MLEFVVIVLSIAFYLYTIFGGADFGAGTLELFTGNKSIKPIYKAIAPVWEANHIWLILAVVIIFNAFPEIYAEMSISLHIPLFVILIGIIIRGTAFTFRHYDAYQDNSQFYYNLSFRFSSILTSFFLGITLGAMMLGEITTATDVSFAERFITPWLNPFCFSVGAFSSVLFAYIASAYIIGEVDTPEEQVYFSTITRRFCVATVSIGSIVLVLAYMYEAPFTKSFFQSPVSLICFGLASILLLFIWRSISKKQFNTLRILVAAQVAMIMAGWAAIQLPVVIFLKDIDHLTLYNTVADENTLYYLCIALCIGSCLIFPALFYLFRVFKGKRLV